MASLFGWFRRLRRKDDLDPIMQDEIAFHLDHQIEKNIRSGMTPGEARRAAMLRFGGVEAAKEAARDELGLSLVRDLGRDLEYGVRTLRRTPGFTLTAVVTLALGMASSTALFAVVNGVLLRSLPYPDADRIVRLYQVSERSSRNNVSEPNFLDWQRGTRRFRGMAQMAPYGAVPVAGAFDPMFASITVVSAAFFDVLGVQPQFGRAFDAGELREAGVPAIIASHAFWARAFGAAPFTAERTVRVGETAFRIVGVMPRGFDYPGGTELWRARERDEPQTSRTAHNYQVVARLADGASLEDARADISTLSRALKAQHGDRTWMVDAMVVPLREQMTAAAEPALKMLFGASILLLVIACINVSSLWLARSESRRRELSVQLAIGASRFRIARQLFGEAVVLTVIAGLLGALLATWAIQVLIALEPGGLPRVDAIAIDWTVLGFGFGVTMATALALAWITLRRGSAPDVREALATGWRAAADPRSARTREILVAGQVALTLVLLAGSALLIRSFTAVQAVDPGFRLDDALVVDITLNTANADGARVKQIQFQDELLARLKRLPGVVDAGLVSSFPLGGGGYPNGRFLEMTHVDEIQSPADVEKLGAEVAKRAGNAGYRVVSDGYFAAMGIPVVRGRTFDDRDAAAAPHAAIVSEAFVASRWPDRDPIGRFVQFGNMDGDPRGFTIVGVVGDVREVTTEAPPGPLFYVSHRQRPRFASRSTVVVRGPEPAAISPTVQRIIRDLDPALPVVVRTMTGAMDRTLSGRRFSLTLIAVFGCAALALATLGTYALIAFVVAQRAREMGIRIALGARPADLLRLIVGKGARLGLAGAGVGLAAAFGLTRLLQGMLFGVEPGDFVSHAVVVTLTLVAVLLASYIPARRATRTDPSTSLRAL